MNLHIMIWSFPSCYPKCPCTACELEQTKKYSSIQRRKTTIIFLYKNCNIRDVLADQPSWWDIISAARTGAHYTPWGAKHQNSTKILAFAIELAIRIFYLADEHLGFIKLHVHQHLQQIKCSEWLKMKKKYLFFNQRFRGVGRDKIPSFPQKS